VVDARMKCAGPAPLDPPDVSMCAQVARLAGRLGAPVTRAGPAADHAPAIPAPLPGTRAGNGVLLNATFGRAIRARGVVLAEHPRNGSEVARQAVGDLVSTLTSARDRGLRGDCFVWVIGCEAADVRTLSHLLSLGRATGSAILLSVTSSGLAADLADEAGLVIASGPVAVDLAQRLADLGVRVRAAALAMGHETPIDAPLGATTGNSRPSALKSATLIARNSDPVSFRVVPVAITEVR
jgi:hypothetical protein